MSRPQLSPSRLPSAPPSLTPAISGARVQEAAAVCETLEAHLEGRMRAAHASAQGNDVHEKAAQRRLRADIAAFLRARGECRDGTGALTGHGECLPTY